MARARHRVVARLTGDMATATFCDHCGWTGHDDDPASGLVLNGMVGCPECGHAVEYRYDEGTRCAGCQRLALGHPLRDALGSYCSTRCQLQAEYARDLERRDDG